MQRVVRPLKFIPPTECQHAVAYPTRGLDNGLPPKRCLGVNMAEPLSYEIDVPSRRVVVIYAALPTFAEWSQAMERVFADPNYQPGFGMFLDARSIGASATDYVTRMVEFIDRHRKRAGGCRWAILVEDESSFGMGRMAEQLSSCEFSIRTFRDRAKAEEWLTCG